ncbi:uromodulin-like [Anneissia japonica]|uniref:uromodulin-like n=1 Tax=Anneissia japonica TaxID=1529436 RepID=UPI001425B95F|nr:uromodulin-like [Anneissia japonica]
MRFLLILSLILLMGFVVDGGFRVRRRRRRGCSRVNCSWSSWSSWSSCSIECGTGGSQTRTRSISRAASCGGSACSGSSSQTISCSGSCPRGTPIPGGCECPFPYTGTCCRETIQENNCINRFTLVQPWRSTKNHQVSGQACDSNALMAYWYQFTGKGGNKMPTACVVADRCGVHSPICVSYTHLDVYKRQGAHPSVDSGIVTRQVCKSLSTDGVTNCCEWSSNIRVQNCGEYFIYSLPKLNACGSGFCAGEEMPCPKGTNSPNGYTPNCMAGPPVLTTPPLLVLTENQFGLLLECSFSFQQFSNMTFDVTWFGDGTELPAASVSLTTERIATLTQQQIGDVFDDNQAITMTCKLNARFIYPDGSPKSPNSQTLESKEVHLTV